MKPTDTVIDVVIVKDWNWFKAGVRTKYHSFWSWWYDTPKIAKLCLLGAWIMILSAWWHVLRAEVWNALFCFVAAYSYDKWYHNTTIQKEICQWWRIFRMIWAAKRAARRNNP